MREVSFVIHIKRAGSLPVIGGLEAEPHPWTPFPRRETRGQATSEQGFHHLYPCAGSSRKPSVRGPDSSQTREHVRCWEGGAPKRPELTVSRPGSTSGAGKGVPPRGRSRTARPTPLPWAPLPLGHSRVVSQG